MSADVRDQSLILDMLDSAQAIVDMTTGMTLESYAADRRTRRAVEREIEIIGEAAGKVSSEMQSAYQKVPWRRIAGQRNRLAHE